MPAPAGYEPISAPGGPPPGYSPITIAQAQGGTPDDSKPSAFQSFVQNSPIGAVQGLAEAIRNPKSAVRGMLKQTGDILQEAKESYRAGDYGSAAVHFLNYALSPIGGAAMDAAGNDFAAGHIAQGAAKTAGLATTLAAGAKAPQILEAAGNAADAAPAIPKAIVAGAKAGTPDVAAGAAKIAGGEVLAKLPGMEFPARIGMGYPGARQVAKGIEKGGKAFMDELRGKVQAATERATADAIAQMQGHKSFQDAPAARQAAIRTQAAGIADQRMSPEDVSRFAEQTPEPASDPLLDQLAQSQAGKKFVNLSADEQDTIRRLAGQIHAEPGATPPSTEQASHESQPAAVEQTPPAQPARTSAAAPAGVKPSAQPASADIAQQLFDELRKGGWQPPAAEPEPAISPETGGNLRDLMREVPAGGARKAVADAGYAGGVADNPELAGKTYEAAARAEKADKMAAALHAHGLNSEMLGKASAADLKEMIEPLRQALGIKRPMSQASIGEMLFRLQRLEGKQ